MTKEIPKTAVDAPGHAQWDRAPDAYHRYFSNLTALTIEPLLDAVADAPGTSLLDIACGPGYAAAAAQRRGWFPVGIDFSEAMVAFAQKLHPSIEFRQGNAEALDFHDAELDRAVMNFGILHLARPEAAIGEAHRALRTGGSFGFTMWAKPEESVGFSIVLGAVEQFGDPSVAPPPGPPFFRFSDRDECSRVLETCGFKNVTAIQLPLVWKLASPNDYFDAFYHGSARTGGMLRAQPPVALAKVREAIQQRVSLYTCGDHLEVPTPALVVSARKT